MKFRIIATAAAVVALLGISAGTANAGWEWKIPCDKHAGKMC